MSLTIWANMTGATNRTVQSKELRDLVASLCEATGQRWEVEQRDIETRGWFRKSVKSYFTVYSYLGLADEWQVMCFAGTSEGGMFGTMVDYRSAWSMLHWYLEGIREGKKAKRSVA